MKIIFLIYLFLHIYLCLYNESEFQDNPNNPDNRDFPNISDFSNIKDIDDIPDIHSEFKAEYQLNIKNENGEDKIELKPGVYSKIIFQITPLNKHSSDDFLFFNETFYKLIIEDEKIIALEKEIIIKPNKDFAFFTYIGLNCMEEIDDSEYTIPIKITHLDNSTEEIPIKYEDINIKIIKEKAKFDFDILMKSIPGKSFNFFKISNELYNIENITIEIRESEGSQSKEVFIEHFGEREELSEKNPENHGILLSYSFGTKKTADELGNTNFSFVVNIKDNKCFELEKNVISFNISRDLPAPVNETTKIIFKNKFEDLTIEHNVINTIKLRTFIPVSPVVLICQFYPFSSIKENSTETNKRKLYRNVINNIGYFDIIMNDLDNYKEYYSYCQISNTNFVKEELNRTSILIGKFLNVDIFHQLIPSRDPNLIPQCANFTFSDKASLGLFKLYSKNYCKYIMKMDEPLPLQSLETITCKTIDDLEDINMLSETICLAPLSSYNYGNFIKEKNKKDFENKFDEFIDKIQNITIPIYGKLIKVQKVEKNYDIVINSLSINATISEKDSSIIGVKQFVFNVLSTHSYPVECYYNLNLDENSYIFQLEASTILKPNQSQQIKVGIIPDLSENKMYSLNFLCYNLPGFKYRYKSTGNMIMYTYLNSNIEGLEQLVKYIPSPLTINCNAKKSQVNPRCLNDISKPLIQQLQSDIPTYYIEIFNEGKAYSSMSMKAQEQYLNIVVNDYLDNINNSDFKSLIENSTTIFNYLKNLDCSLYSSGESNKDSETYKNKDYLNCKNAKKEYFGKVINSIKPYLDCSSLINKIISGLGDDLEENFKYISFLINEMSNNQDSYEKELSKILFDTSFCLHDNFDNYWGNIDKYLNEEKQYLKNSIDLVKKDALITIFQSLTNSAKIIHYEEIDGSIQGQKTNTGLFISDMGQEIQKKIINFSKNFNEFGDAFYSLSGTTFLKVELNKGLGEEYDSEIKTVNITEKNLLINIYSNYMLRKNNAKYLQVLVFDSPLVSVKSNEKKDDTSDSVNIFVNIILYNDNNEEISIKDIDSKYKPEILYLKNAYDSLKKCFYYNEENNELENDGVLIEENYEYNGQKYVKCASSHLTSFTAGTYDFNSNLAWWVVLLIIFGILLLLMIFVFIIIIIKKRNKNTNNINKNSIISNFKEKEMMDL